MQKISKEYILELSDKLAEMHGSKSERLNIEEFVNSGVDGVLAVSNGHMPSSVEVAQHKVTGELCIRATFDHLPEPQFFDGEGLPMYVGESLEEMNEYAEETGLQHTGNYLATRIACDVFRIIKPEYALTEDALKSLKVRVLNENELKSFSSDTVH